MIAIYTDFQSFLTSKIHAFAYLIDSMTMQTSYFHQTAVTLLTAECGGDKAFSVFFTGLNNDTLR